MKEIGPEPGSIYMLRLSIPEAFGIFESGEAETSSFTSYTSSSSTKGSAKSSASPTKPKKKRYYKRPCVVLFVHSESTTVLAITRFHGHDLASTNTNTTVLPQLTRNDVFKHILSIYPTPPVFGRKSIQIKSTCSSTYFTHQDKHYLILKPISISSGTKWAHAIPDFIDPNDLLYISQIIYELTAEERKSSTGNSQLQIISTNPGDKTDDKEDTDDDAKTTSSSSSLPMPRFEQYLLLQNDLNKSYQVQQWLNNLESSSNSTAEDILEGLSIDFIIK